MASSLSLKYFRENNKQRFACYLSINQYTGLVRLILANQWLLLALYSAMVSEWIYTPSQDVGFSISTWFAVGVFFSSSVVLCRIFFPFSLCRDQIESDGGSDAVRVMEKTQNHNRWLFYVRWMISDSQSLRVYIRGVGLFLAPSSLSIKYICS